MRVPQIAVALVATAAIGGCGSEERSFEAREFVEEANRAGAGLELGEPLTSVNPETDVYALRLGASDPEAEQVGGSLTVTDDAEAARAEFARCEQAVSLICFRAANVIVIFEEGLAPGERMRVESAFRALESS